MTDNKSTDLSKKSFIDKTWVSFLIFIVGTTLLGGLSCLLGGRMTNYLSWDRPPFSALPICFFCTRMLMYLALGFAVFFVYREKSRKLYNRNIDLILFYTQIFFYLFFPLFFFRLGLVIFATIWLGIAIVLAIITLVRFWSNNLTAGIIYSIYVLWLLYVFYVSLGVCLL